jgi:hypothetical protein
VGDALLRAASRRVPPGRARRGERAPALDLDPGEGLQGRSPVAEHVHRGHPQGRPPRGKDYDYNKTEKVFTFYAGDGETLLSTVEFRSADDPQSLRGAGLDILWIDESAFIPSQDAWDVVFPALTDKLGIVITTTTPNGKNWFYEDCSSPTKRARTRQFRVEYTSIDNPYFPRQMWEYALKHYHPVMFRQEFMAAFDAMAGVSLSGEWLKFFVDGNPDIQTEDIGLPRYRDDNGDMRANLDCSSASTPRSRSATARTTSPSPSSVSRRTVAGVPARLLGRPDPDPRAARQDPRVVPQVPTALHRHRSPSRTRLRSRSSPRAWRGSRPVSRS